MQRMTLKEFVNYPLVHLDALREGNTEFHPAMTGTSTDLAQLDDADSVPRPFLDQEAVVVNCLDSDGPRLSPAHTEVIERRETP